MGWGFVFYGEKLFGKKFPQIGQKFFHLEQHFLNPDFVLRVECNFNLCVFDYSIYIFILLWLRVPIFFTKITVLQKKGKKGAKRKEKKAKKKADKPKKTDKPKKADKTKKADKPKKTGKKEEILTDVRLIDADESRRQRCDCIQGSAVILNSDDIKHGASFIQ